MFDELLKKTKDRREADAKRLSEHDTELCMLCGAYGPDKRSLYIGCLYSLDEVSDRFIDLFDTDEKHKGLYYLRICKACRGALLTYLRTWIQGCISLELRPKDHDGFLLDTDTDGLIPVRVAGTTVYMTEEQYAEYRRSAEQAK